MHFEMPCTTVHLGLHSNAQQGMPQLRLSSVHLKMDLDASGMEGCSYQPGSDSVQV